MAKKLVTIRWEHTVEMDLPENATAEMMEDYENNYSLYQKGMTAMLEAFKQLNPLADGEIVELRENDRLNKPLGG